MFVKRKIVYTLNSWLNREKMHNKRIPADVNLIQNNEWPEALKLWLEIVSLGTWFWS